MPVFSFTHFPLSPLKLWPTEVLDITGWGGKRQRRELFQDSFPCKAPLQQASAGRPVFVSDGPCWWRLSCTVHSQAPLPKLPPPSKHPISQAWLPQHRTQKDLTQNVLWKTGEETGPGWGDAAHCSPRRPAPACFSSPASFLLQLLG